MSEAEVLDVARDAILTLLMVAGPLMAISLTVGLLIALFQALTQIQEVTLTFVPKIVVVFVSMLLILPFMVATMRGFTEQLFDRIVGIGIGA
ncbi:MAG: flagellar biosynthesis protein FliQ [Alphaproteobacteria bacterium]|nr:flagellar biosynthesis protein FliQ [Alphaproteobacteria bacterium]